MDIDIYEEIIIRVVKHIRDNDMIMSEINTNIFKVLILEQVEEYSNYLDKQDCKKIIKSYGSFFEVLRIYADCEDIYELFNNNEINFFRDLAKFVIYKRWFDESHKLVNAYEYVAEHFIDNNNDSDKDSNNNNSDNEN